MNIIEKRIENNILLDTTNTNETNTNTNDNDINNSSKLEDKLGPKTKLFYHTLYNHI